MEHWADPFFSGVYFRIYEMTPSVLSTDDFVCDSNYRCDPIFGGCSTEFVEEAFYRPLAVE